MMRKKKIYALLCTLAYLIVFAHSVVPHDHHIHCIGEGAEAEAHHHHGLPHHGSCELLDFFTVSDALSDDEIAVCLGEILPSEPLELEIPSAPTPFFHHRVEAECLNDAPPLPCWGLRAPPVA